jgi:hypothetical protein
MNPNKPTAEFLLPYYLFVDEDKKQFLGENLLRGLKRELEGTFVHPQLVKQILSYGVVFVIRTPEPEKLKLTKSQVEKMLKPFFQDVKMSFCNYEYEQLKSPRLAPVIQVKIYF